MSHPRQVRVLAYNQPVISKRSAFILVDIADLLVQRMAAERISQSVIRMLAPGSVFLPAKDFSQTLKAIGVPLCASANMYGCVFRDPESEDWLVLHWPAIQCVRRRARLISRSIALPKRLRAAEMVRGWTEATA